MGNRIVRKPAKEEIVKRIKARAYHDILNLEVPDYARYLDPASLREAIPSIDEKIARSCTEETWSEQEFLRLITEYLPKAFDWANREKDMETARAFGHFVAWTWLIGDVDFSSLIEMLPWEQYGKPHFRMIAERYDVDWSKMDDGVLRELPSLGADNLSPDGGLTANIGGNPEPSRSHKTAQEIEDEAWSALSKN